MTRFSRYLLLLFFALPIFILASCASNKEIPQTHHPLVPYPEPIIDPSDLVLKQSILNIMKQTGGPLNSTYRFGRIDLNSDGRRDAVVIFKTPYGFWCGTHGCTMLVMQAHNEEFTLLSAIQTIRPPIYISEHKSNGWKNIIVRVSGRTIKAKDVALQFDGTSYPQYPDIIAPVSKTENNSRVKLID